MFDKAFQKKRWNLKIDLTLPWWQWCDYPNTGWTKTYLISTDIQSQLFPLWSTFITNKISHHGFFNQPDRNIWRLIHHSRHVSSSCESLNVIHSRNCKLIIRWMWALQGGFLSLDARWFFMCEKRLIFPSSIWCTWNPNGSPDVLHTRATEGEIKIIEGKKSQHGDEALTCIFWAHSPSSTFRRKQQIDVATNPKESRSY